MSKKVISILLSAAMLIAILCVGFGSVTASAAEAIHVGDRITVTVYFTGIDAVTGFGGDLTYDSSVLSYKSRKLLLEPDEDAQTDFFLFANNSEAGLVQFSGALDVEKGTDCVAKTGLATFTFDVIANADLDNVAIASKLTLLSHMENGISTVVIGNDPDTKQPNGVPDTYSSVSDPSDIKVVHNESSDTTDTEGTDSATTDSEDTDSATTDSEDTDSATTDSEDTDSATIDSEDTDSATTDSEDTDSATTDSENTDSATSDSASDSASDTASDSASDSSKGSDTSSSGNGGNGNNGGNGSVIQTAGTFAVISLVVILMAAAAVVLYTRKKTEE